MGGAVSAVERGMSPLIFRGRAFTPGAGQYPTAGSSSLNLIAKELNTRPMSFSLTSHGFLARRPRRLTTFVSLLWLNLAMLPCTMAAGSGEFSGEDHCPPSAAAAHHVHMSAQDSDGDDDHGSHGHHDVGTESAEQDDAAASHSCFGSDDCCELDDVLFSDGGKKLERESGALSPVSFASMHAESISTSVRNLRATGPPPRFAGSVRPHALCCVYRD